MDHRNEDSLPKKVYFLCLLFCLITFAGLIHFIVEYHYVIPVSDHLYLSRFFDLKFKESLALGDFFEPHNGHHWHVFSFISLFLLAYATNWDILYLTLIPLILPLISIILLYKISNKMLKNIQLEKYSIIFLPLITFFILSYDQTTVWLWGWQVHNHIVITCLVAMIYCLYQDTLNIKYLIAAIICALIATYSFALGLLLWPLGFILLLLHSQTTKLRHYAHILWLLCSTLIIFHFLSSNFKTSEVSEFYFLQLILYCISLMGGALAVTPFDTTLVFIIATYVLILLFIRHIGLKKLSVYSPYVILILFSFGSSGLIGLARHQYGLMQALLPRYISFSNLFWLSLMLLIVIHFLIEAKNHNYKIKSVFNLYSNVFLMLVALGVFFFKIDNFSYRFPQAYEQYRGATLMYEHACKNELIEFYTHMIEEITLIDTEDKIPSNNIINFHGPKSDTNRIEVLTKELEFIKIMKQYKLNAYGNQTHGDCLNDTEN